MSNKSLTKRKVTMRNVRILILTLVMCLSFCACTSTSNQNTNVLHGIGGAENDTQSSNTSNNSSTLNSGYPSADEYDEIILEDSRYYLCKKDESGFNSDAEYYGIYDSEKRQWAMEYTELSSYDMSYFDFCSHGNGVFSYTYSLHYGTVVFLSAELGDTFKTTEKVYHREKIYFDDGKALVLLSKDSKYVNGIRTPDNELFWIDTYGKITNVSIADFDANVLLYWNELVLPSANGYSCREIYVRSFFTFINNEKTYYIFIYFYDTNSCIIIDEQDYASKLESTNVNAVVVDDLIRITNLKGDDGKDYYAEFDREGNLVKEATLMDELFK